MPVHYKDLNREDRQVVHDLALGTYLDGECYAFAIALHRGLGWPMLGLMEGEVIRHACVSAGPELDLFDVRGPIKRTDRYFGRPFAFAPPYTLREISEEDLRRVRPIKGNSIATATWMAQLLWPYLPWPNSHRQKFEKFLIELEELCKKHEIYIFAAIEGAWPCLTYAEGDERGFALRPTMNGFMHQFNRVL